MGDQDALTTSLDWKTKFSLARFYCRSHEFLVKLHETHSRTSLTRTRLTQTPRQLQHKIISLEVFFQSFTIGYLEPRYLKLFSFPLAVQDIGVLLYKFQKAIIRVFKYSHSILTIQ